MNIGKYEELPINNIHIKTALGSKSRRIQHIILLPIEILQNKINLQFLIVPNLIKPVILGIEFMKQFQVIINFADNKMNMTIDNRNILLDLNNENTTGVICQLSFSDEKRKSQLPTCRIYQ